MSESQGTDAAESGKTRRKQPHSRRRLSPEERIRRRVLRAIALNRTPGLHFPGNFIELSFDHVASGDTRVSYETGPHCVDAHGGSDIGSLAILADFALGTAVRADLHPAPRQARASC